jgi:integrase
VRRFAAKLRASMAPSSAAVILAVTSGLFRHAVRDGLAERNPVRELDRDDRPSAQRLTEPRYLTTEELARLLDALGDTWRPVAATCAYAGLRISEALGLRWRDVDFAASVIRVEQQLGPQGELVPVKTHASEAPAPLLPALARELKAHRLRQAVGLDRIRPEALVFQTRNGRPQSRRNALRAVHAAGDAAGLNPEGREKVGLHDLRHSFVGLALDAGASLAEAAALARHADARVTATVYAGLADDGRAKAAAKLLAAGFGA